MEFIKVGNWVFFLLVWVLGFLKLGEIWELREGLGFYVSLGQYVIVFLCLSFVFLEKGFVCGF